MQQSDPPHLDHEGLDVYRVSIEFLSLALSILATLPKRHRELRAQLERAAMSVPINIAEGSGKPALSADRARYYATARGSALECGAILDVCSLMGHVPPERIEHGKRLLARTVAMLTRMGR